MKLNDQRLSVSDAFSQCRYVVPDFQRQYVWEDEEVQELIEDIQNAFLDDATSHYFLGTTIGHQLDDGRMEIIDGQQRITSLFVWLCAFRQQLLNTNQAEDIGTTLCPSKIDEQGDSITNWRLELQYDSSNSLLRSIYDGAAAEGSSTSGSGKRLADAYLQMQGAITRFQGDYDKDRLRKLLGFLLNHVILIQIETSSLGDALKIFETTNDRGVGLNPMDLLKNLIFSKLKPQEFGKAKSDWKLLVHLLETNKVKGLRFLRYFLMAQYDTAQYDTAQKGRGIVREEHIYDWIRGNEGLCHASKDPKAFMATILEAAHAYVQFAHGKDVDGDPEPYLENIRNGTRSFSFHLLIMLAGRRLRPEESRWLAKQTEVLVFYFVFLKSPTRELEPKLAAWAKELRSIAEDGNDQHQRLCEFVRKNYLPEAEARREDFKRRLEEVTEEDLQQYQLRYLLAKIAQYTDLARSGGKDPEDLKYYLNQDIEHILPKTPTSAQQGRFEKLEPRKKYGDYKVKLGNLTLLEKSFNKSIGRKEFQEKLAVYDTSRLYLTKSISSLDTVGKNTSLERLNPMLSTFLLWDADDIDRRQKMLATLALKVWDLDVPDQDQ